MATIEVMISAEQIDERIRELAKEVRQHYAGKTITCIGVLKGCFVFMADFVRALEGDVTVEFLGVSSYRGTQSSGEVRITHDLNVPIEGRDCLIVEDIVDTGLTLAFLHKTLSVRKPASLRVVTLLDKPSRRAVEVQVDWVGFTIPDAFVIGYGLDLDQRYRNLPYIGLYQG